jgi:hypothetical protein
MYHPRSRNTIIIDQASVTQLKIKKQKRVPPQRLLFSLSRFPQKIRKAAEMPQLSS